ncbi:u3 small nucleolar RNA-associated protein 15 homolog [Caerostris extrusa]|uniref:U3 small nucleolar RNA-associated protein 15 homolog n=1 Tax=Caerostris extrusa TaxID=172846 RepID=A0AAV4QLH0_CAEEX|nr:u3 small nucleolar RNA-associated protein 15 homolog [Caerostris extrusa]
MDFKPLDINQYPRPGLQVTEDNVYWKNLTFPCAFKEFGGVDFIDFSAELAAVTCSAKVQLYNTAESKLQSTFSRFKRTAYGGVFRKDGNLLVAGSEDGFLRLFDVQGNRMLRVFKGHKAATHRCNFTPSGVNIVSFSDDKTAAFWDIPTETKLRSFEGHKDYIRAGAVTSQDFFISGSYDHTVKLWDARTGGTVSTVDHGAPVESVIMFPQEEFLYRLVAQV